MRLVPLIFALSCLIAGEGFAKDAVGSAALGDGLKGALGEGGLVASLKTGGVQDRVAAARAEREAALASGAVQLVGVTKFVDPDPRPAPFEIEREARVASGGDACDPLIPVRFAAPFETQQWAAGR